MSIFDMAPLFAISVAVLALFALLMLFASNVSTGHKVLWVILILVLPFIGSVAYFIVHGTGAPASDDIAHDNQSATRNRYTA